MARLPSNWRAANLRRGGFSSKCRRAATEGQPRRGGGADRILKNDRHRGGAHGTGGGRVQRQQGQAGRAAHIAMPAGGRRVVTGRLIASSHAAESPKLSGAHILGQHGHRCQQRREHGQKPQPRGKTCPKRAGGRGDWHGTIIGSSQQAAQNATKSGATHAHQPRAGGRSD